jgi:signal peptidase II
MTNPTGSFLDQLKSTKMIIFVVVSVLMIAADQISKIMVVKNIRYLRETIDVIPGFLSFVHTQNPGAAIGLFGDLPTAIRLTIFGVFTVLAVGVIISFLWQLPRNDKFQSLTLGLIFSGAIGNAIDRIHKQTVTDFIRVYTDHPQLEAWLRDHVGTNEYPTFNIADAAIVVGVGLFLVRYLFLDDSDDANESGDEAAQLVGADDHTEQVGKAQDEPEA